MIYPRRFPDKILKVYLLPIKLEIRNAGDKGIVQFSNKI